MQRGRPQPAGSRRTHPEKGRSPSAGEGQPGSGSCCRRVTTAPAFPHPGPTRRRLASLARASRKRTRGGGNREGRAEQALPRSRPTRPRLPGRAQARCPRRPLPPPRPVAGLTRRRRRSAFRPGVRRGRGGGGVVRSAALAAAGMSRAEVRRGAAGRYGGWRRPRPRPVLSGPRECGAARPGAAGGSGRSRRVWAGGAGGSGRPQLAAAALRLLSPGLGPSPVAGERRGRERGRPDAVAAGGRAGGGRGAPLGAVLPPGPARVAAPSLPALWVPGAGGGGCRFLALSQGFGRAAGSRESGGNPGAVRSRSVPVSPGEHG